MTFSSLLFKEMKGESAVSSVMNLDGKSAAVSVWIYPFRLWFVSLGCIAVDVCFFHHGLLIEIYLQFQLHWSTVVVTRNKKLTLLADNTFQLNCLQKSSRQSQFGFREIRFLPLMFVIEQTQWRSQILACFPFAIWTSSIRNMRIQLFLY